MSQLIVINDSIIGERETLDLYCGESLASNLRRHWPGGIAGPWRIYRGNVHPDMEIAALELPHVVVAPFQTFILTRGTAADPVSFFINLAISLALSYIATLLNPRPKTRTQAGEDDTSGGNQLAGQSNRLRPGARVPDLLGRVRAYPDLLTAPLEWWTGRTQQLEQHFVLGMGDYLVEYPKLGETPLSAISGAGLAEYPSDYGAFTARASKSAPEIRSMSLMEAESPVLPSTSTQFIAPNTLRTVDKLEGVEVGNMLAITISLLNSGFQKVTSVPPGSQTVGPWDYTVDLPVVNETVIPQLMVYELDQEWLRTTAVGIDWYPVVNLYDGDAEFTNAMASGAPMDAHGDSISLLIENGWIVDTAPDTLPRTRGRIRNFGLWFETGYDPPGAPAPYIVYQHTWQTLNIADVLIGLTTGQDTADIRFYKPKGEAGTGEPPPPGPINPVPTPWYRAPLEIFDALWLDISFPQGLVRYDTGFREETAVAVLFEFKRPGSSVAQANFPASWQEATAAPLRFTSKLLATELTGLGLPAGVGVDVRVTRVTPITPDTATVQYNDETRWESMVAVKDVLAIYPDVTVLKLGMTNTRSAVSLGENVFNCVATRKLPGWSAGAFTAPRATRKWADNFVHRCRQPDGANKINHPEQIDLAGIYALQDQLDNMEGGSHDPITGGPQGQIALTLDIPQDVDAELAQIADVIRAVVYRVGKKIYVSRDQANATSLALFNARTKSPDAESVAVRMTNDGENDAVTVTWLDEQAGYKVREFTYPPTGTPINPLRVGAFLANWPQAWRRAVYEMNRVRYRREQLTVNVTEDGRICRPGDVVNITDDIANLAAMAGEVLYVSGLVYTLDRDVVFTAGHTHTILLRDVLGQTTDSVPVTAVAGSPNKVQLSRVPVISIKPRDTSMGTLFAFFDDAAANVRRWLLTSVALSGPYVKLEGTNYSPLVYQGDSATLPVWPPIVPLLAAPEPTP